MDNSNLLSIIEGTILGFEELADRNFSALEEVESVGTITDQMTLLEELSLEDDDNLNYERLSNVARRGYDLLEALAKKGNYVEVLGDEYERYEKIKENCGVE